MNGLTCLGLTLLVIIGGVALALLRRPTVPEMVEEAVHHPRWPYDGPIPKGRWVDTA